MMVMLNTAGKLTVNDYYSSDFVKPGKLTPISLSLTNSVVNSTGIYGHFSRPLQTTSSLNKKISIGLSTDFSFAYLTTANQGFVHHNNQGVGAITFGAKNSTSEWVPNGNVTGESYLSLDNNFKMGWIFTDSSISITFHVSSI